MIKILASGDHHFDQHSRFSECIRVHRWMVEEVRRRKPVAFLSGGDIYERASTPVERAAVAEWLAAIADLCTVIVARGNHDAVRDLELLGRLRTRYPVIVEERCGVHYVENVAVAVLAWPERATLLAQLGSSAETDMAAGDAMRAVLRGLGAELAAHDGPKILLTHAQIDGAVTSVGQPLIGAPMNVGLADLALANADIVVASHIHKSQEWAHGDCEILYCGSSYRTAFGETESKSIVELTMGQDVAMWDRIPTPATQMILLSGQWWPDATGGACFGYDCEEPALNDRLSVGEFSGAEIRFRYSCDSDHREAAKRAAAEVKATLLEHGAVSVKVEEQVIAITRARAPEISAAKTLSEKLEILWTVRKDVPDAARRERLLGKLSQVEQEVA